MFSGPYNAFFPPLQYSLLTFSLTILPKDSYVPLYVNDSKIL